MVMSYWYQRRAREFMYINTGKWRPRRLGMWSRKAAQRPQRENRKTERNETEAAANSSGNPQNQSRVPNSRLETAGFGSVWCFWQSWNSVVDAGSSRKYNLSINLRYWITEGQALAL